MKGQHSWKAYRVAGELTQLLEEDGFLRLTDEESIRLVRGIIQIKLEHEY